MFRDLATPVSTGFVLRLATVLGLRKTNKQGLSRSCDRMSALDDPATRRALAGLPEHLLHDIGVAESGDQSASPRPARWRGPAPAFLVRTAPAIRRRKPGFSRPGLTALV